MAKRPAGLTPGSAVGLGAGLDPIEFLRQEHDRQYEICDQLENLPNFFDSDLDLDWLRSLSDFLWVDLPRHVEDEEADFFPILAQRCAAQEGLDLILAQLESEHELDLGLVDPIRAELQAILKTGAPRDPYRLLVDLRAFAEAQRRHLLWENLVVLPMAEKSLTAADRKALSAGLMARRSQNGSMPGRRSSNPTPSC